MSTTLWGLSRNKKKLYYNIEIEHPIEKLHFKYEPSILFDEKHPVYPVPFPMPISESSHTYINPTQIFGGIFSHPSRHYWNPLRLHTSYSLRRCLSSVYSYSDCHKVTQVGYVFTWRGFFFIRPPTTIGDVEREKKYIRLSFYPFRG